MNTNILQRIQNWPKNNFEFSHVPIKDLKCPFCAKTNVSTNPYVYCNAADENNIYPYCAYCGLAAEGVKANDPPEQMIINWWKMCERKERADDLRRQVETFNFLLDQMEEKIKYQTTQVQLEYKRAIVSLLSKEYESEEEKMSVIFSKILVFAALKGIRL